MVILRWAALQTHLIYLLSRWVDKGAYGKCRVIILLVRSRAISLSTCERCLSETVSAINMLTISEIKTEININLNNTRVLLL